MKNLEGQAESREGESGETKVSIHDTSGTEVVWIRATSEGFGTDTESLDPTVSGMESMRALYAGHDPIVHRKRVVAEIAKALETVKAGELRDEKKKSILARLDITSRLGSVRRAFKIFFEDEMNQEGLNFIDNLIIKHWDAYDSGKGRYGDFLKFWKKEAPFNFQYVLQTASRDGYPREKVGDSLLLPYLWSLFSGNPEEMHGGFMDRLMEERNTKEVEIDFKSAPGTVVVSFSLIEMLGRESVISKMMLGSNEKENRIGATDTFVNFYLPIGNKERKFLVEEYEKDPDGTSKVILDALEQSSGIVGLGHGFGASKDVWNSMIGALMHGLNDGKKGEFVKKVGGTFGMEGRIMGFSLSTKGADFTTLEDEDLDNKQESGRMDRAAIQIVESFRAMGLAGWDRVKPLLWVGHSMGGQEALWLPVFADKSWNLKIISVAPVVARSKEFLKILYGKLDDRNGKLDKKISEWKAELMKLILSDDSWLPNKLQEWGALVGKKIGLVGTITADLIIPKGIDRKSTDFKRLVAVVKIHLEQFKNLPFMRGVFKHLRDNDYLNEEWLKKILFMFSDNFEAVYMSGDDDVLGSPLGIEKLILAGWGDKLTFFSDLSHYMIHMNRGILELIKDGKKVMANRLPFNIPVFG